MADNIYSKLFDTRHIKESFNGKNLETLSSYWQLGELCDIQLVLKSTKRF